MHTHVGIHQVRRLVLTVESSPFLEKWNSRRDAWTEILCSLQQCFLVREKTLVVTWMTCDMDDKWNERGWSCFPFIYAYRHSITSGLEFHLWEGKAIFILQRAFPLKNLRVYGGGQLLKGTNTKTRGNRGHSLQGLCEAIRYMYM